MLLSNKDWLEAARIIRRFYNLNRPVTEEEVVAEIANLQRRKDAMSLDNLQENLASNLHKFLN